MTACGRLISASLVACVAACTTVREYPRCYLLRAPTDADVLAANNDARGILEGVVRTADYSFSKDVVAVRATPIEQERLAEIWPEYGCLNLRRNAPLTADMADKYTVALCQQYLRELVSSDDSETPDRRTQIATKYRILTCN